jgi:STE24 endopeptidase
MIRQCEYQADNFAIKYGHGENLKKSLTTLFVRNKGALTADPLYSAYNHSHPTLLERL